MNGHRAAEAESVSTKLERIATLARSDQRLKFTSLAHLLTEEYLRENLAKLNKHAAAGVDGVTVEQYRQSADEHIRGVYEQLRAGRYRASPVRRVYIPKDNGKQRPLGIPTVQDRVVQRAVAGIIQTIYEPYFCDCSYGYRPGRSCHDALEKLRQIVDRQPVRWVVEADIKAYFDTVNHAWLQKFLSDRIADNVIRRLVGKWLRSGIMENGVVSKSEEGTPQGGPISPLLANIYLHYVLDLWFKLRVKAQMRGVCELVRYADDFVVCFEHREEAQKFMLMLRERFKQFHLELSDEKTRVVEFGKYSSRNGQKGTEETRTFDFLGFTHYMRKRSKRGVYRLARKPSAKRRRRFLRSTQEFLSKHRQRDVWWQAYRLKAKLQGYYAYYGLRHCKKTLEHLKWHVERIWVSQLRRRSQRHKLQWSRMHRYPWFCLLPEPMLR